MQMTSRMLRTLPLLLALSCTKAIPEQDDSPGSDSDSPPDSSEPGRDVDGDGYWSAEDGGLDCDDTDPNIHPGAEETIDGVDQDCDGLIDDGTDVYDGDEDGWSIGDGDCNDSDSATWPGAPDNPCDTIDQDCDGELETCVRADVADGMIVSTGGDRHFGSAVGGSDLWGDGQPDIAAGFSTVNYLFDAPAVGGRLTEQDAYLQIDTLWSGGQGTGGIVFVANVVGGGGTAILISRTGRGEDGVVYLLCEPDTGVVIAENVACASYTDGEGDSSFGWELAGGSDVTGDGFGDLLIAAPYSTEAHGAAYVVSGADRGVLDVELGAAAQIWGSAPGDYLGYSVSMSGDNNGDGIGDVLVGALVEDSMGGAVGWFMGPLSGLTTLTNADVLYTVESPVRAGHRVAGSADLDGDGRDDFAITTWEDGIGSVHLFSDFGGGTIAGAAAHFVGVERADYDTPPGDYLGNSLAFPDANGDGLGDVLAGAPSSAMTGLREDRFGLTWAAGAAALFLAPFSGTRTMLEADGLWFGVDEDDSLGAWVSSIPDFNSDNCDDFLIGSARTGEEGDGVAGGNSAAYLFFGRESW